MKLRLSISVLALAWASSGSAAGFGLMSTGVDNLGNPLAGGALDSHWTVTPGRYVPGPVNPTVLSASNLGNNWLANTTRSQWVSTADRIDSGYPGELCLLPEL